jgi:hypothetical protein
MCSPFLRLVGSKTQKGPADLNDRLAPWLMFLATYMFACPDALNGLFTSLLGWSLSFHTCGNAWLLTPVLCLIFLVLNFMATRGMVDIAGTQDARMCKKRLNRKSVGENAKVVWHAQMVPSIVTGATRYGGIRCCLRQRQCWTYVALCQVTKIM